MQGILYEEASIWQFLLVTVVMGGAAAWITGKACAETWRGIPKTIGYLLVLGLAIRFAHFVLVGGTLLSPHYYIADTAVLTVFGLVAWRATRARQMSTQYWWLYERSGPLSWIQRPAPLSARPEGSR
jgi:hypothetical protein